MQNNKTPTQSHHTHYLVNGGLATEPTGHPPGRGDLIDRSAESDPTVDRLEPRRGWRDFAPLPLRLMLGFGLAYHGFPKIFSMEGHASFVGMLQGMGMPAPEFVAWGVGIFEFFGGLALIAGAFTAAIALIGTIQMAVAGLLVHFPSGFNFLNITGTADGAPTFGMPGYEVNLLYIAGFVALFIGGAGAWSIDRMRERAAIADSDVRVDAEHTVRERAWSGDRRSPTHEEDEDAEVPAWRG